MDFVIRLILFIFLINWLVSMHMLHNESNDSRRRVASIIVSVAIAVAIGFLVI